MNKKEWIAAAAEASGISQKDAKLVLDAAIDTIAAALTAGDKVQLTGFGTFEVKDREARIGRNPHTREAIEIPATRTPLFKPSAALKEQVKK